MIDDLITRGVTEPYRMFTSRAEFRLSLRADNADQRLTPGAIQLGCVSAEQTRSFRTKMDALATAEADLQAETYTPQQANAAGIHVSNDGARRTAYQLLAFPNVGFEQIVRLDPGLGGVDEETRAQVSRDALYSNYIVRQERDIAALKRDEAHEIPLNFNYASLKGLSIELTKKLEFARPATLAHAGRVEGITPAALTLILARLKQAQRKRTA